MHNGFQITPLFIQNAKGTISTRRDDDAVPFFHWAISRDTKTVITNRKKQTMPQVIQMGLQNARRHPIEILINALRECDDKNVLSDY